MVNSQELFMHKVLRLASNLPQQRYEIFRRLYVQGQPVEMVRMDLRMNEDQFEHERKSLLRSLIRA
jgi:hypothetical protein